MKISIMLTIAMNWGEMAYLDSRDSGCPLYEVFGGMGRNDLTEQKLRIPSNPHIRWVWVANAGHYLPHEWPTAVAKVINNLNSIIKIQTLKCQR